MVFEKNIIDFLETEKTGDLHILSDFYWKCVELLNLQDGTHDYKKNTSKIRYRLNKMRKKGLIDCRRTGTGFLGKTDFGSTSSNTYTLPNFWI